MTDDGWTTGCSNLAADYALLSSATPTPTIIAPPSATCRRLTRSDTARKRLRMSEIVVSHTDASSKSGGKADEQR